MKKGIKKFLKMAKEAGTKKLPKKTARLRELVADTDKGVILAKLQKDGTATPRKTKAGATHLVIETPNGGAIAEPIKRWPKPPKQMSVPAPLGAQVEAKSNSLFDSPIPHDATHLAWESGGIFLMEPIRFADDYKYRGGGTLRFGKLRYGEDFVVLAPEAEEGNVIRWKDGSTCFAEGKSPIELKRAEKSAMQAAERRANPPEHVKEAFAAQAKARRAAPGPRPGDIAGKIQNGVRKPGAGGKTARVWDICDELLKKLGRCPTKAEVFAISVDKEKASPGMTGTNYSYWRRFYGHVAQ